jgi:hypothetical protein
MARGIVLVRTFHFIAGLRESWSVSIPGEYRFQASKPHWNEQLRPLRQVLIGMSGLNMLTGKLGRNGVSSDVLCWSAIQRKGTPWGRPVIPLLDMTSNHFCRQVIKVVCELSVYP